MCWTPEPKNSEMKRAAMCASRDDPLITMRRLSPGIDQRLALHQPARIGDLHLRQALEVENAGIEQKPRQHLVIRHRLRDMIDMRSRLAAAGFFQRVEIGVPVCPLGVEKIQELPPRRGSRGFPARRPTG